MAITTLDGVIAGVKPPIYFSKLTGTTEASGVGHSLLYAVGMPGPAVAPTSAVAGDALTSYAGQLPMPSFANNTHLLRFVTRCSVATQSTVLLCDRLWHNASMDETQTTAQTIDSTAWPARDANGSTNGVGVLVGIEVSTATSNGSAITNTEMTYTNSAGTGSRTATIPAANVSAGFPATAVAGTFVPFRLQAGDTGVRSIQSLTLGTTYGTGVIHLVAYRVLATIELFSSNVAEAQDMTRGGFPRLYDNTVPFLIVNALTTTTHVVEGQIFLTQG
jgi:hypothetical protein